MARFSNTPAKARPALLASTTNRVQTFEGGLGFENTAQTELFLTAVSGLLKDQFYESGADQLDRLATLVSRCDPSWIAPFVKWLRNEANIRSASLVIAAEYARMKGPNARSVVNSVLQRADEPGEMLGYWFSQYGRQMPMALKRGIGDAVKRLYTENALLRYDGSNKGWRFGDVIEIVHPIPSTEKQSALFKFALDRRRNAVSTPEELGRISQVLNLQSIPAAERRARLDEAVSAGFSWERLGSWLPGGLDASAWSALVPELGYMALLRNLRNLEDAHVPVKELAKAAARIANAEEVAKSKQLPYRFLSAYMNTKSDRFKQPLNDALEESVKNLPLINKNVLIMVDCSGSMGTRVGNDSRGTSPTRSQVAGLFAVTLARRAKSADIVSYDTRLLREQKNAHLDTQSVLGVVNSGWFRPNGGTDTWHCTSEAFRRGRYDLVIILTDEQTSVRDTSIVNVPVVTWNVAGYAVAHAQHGSHNRFVVGGFSDQILDLIPSVVGLASSGRWPWER
jgi:hypothetical protein